MDKSRGFNWLPVLMVSIFTLVGACMYFLGLLDKDSLGDASCRVNDSGHAYCKYVGKVSHIYVNNDGLALVLFRDDFSAEELVLGNFEPSVTNAMALDLSRSEREIEMWNVVKLAYDEGDIVELHARDVKSGYLHFDRVWIKH